MDLPHEHAAVLTRLQAPISADGRFAGLAAGGSLRTRTLDAFSDLDLILVVEDRHHAAVMSTRHELAASWGTLLSAFTGEHVGEPRLLICLYDDPLMHVDLKFLRLDELAHRTEDPAVLWERGSTVSDLLHRTHATTPAVDEQWIEDRFWVWVHYAATKLGRGELFEVIDFLSFLRQHVLGPMYAARHGEEPRGVRRLESNAPDFAATLAHTVAGHDARQCAQAVWVCIELYRELRRAPGIVPRTAAEQGSTRYLTEVSRAAGPGGNLAGHRHVPA